jgi:hypothetical protein
LAPEHRQRAPVIPAALIQSSEEIAMKTREDRIEARARELSQVDGHPGSKDRKYWAQAAALIDEEDARIAKAAAEDPARAIDPGADPRPAWPTNDPIGVTISAVKRQG